MSGWIPILQSRLTVDPRIFQFINAQNWCLAQQRPIGDISARDRQTEVFWEKKLGRLIQLGHARTVREQADSHPNRLAQNTDNFIGTYRPEKWLITQMAWTSCKCGER